ncbi:cytochrome c5 family protein [Psychrobacter sp. YP14]|jgi:cytochrome c5|uniref:C-type cytochrome n=1 Tax=Psychrobacter raelei TaxID=2565531 RepID=A0AAT9PES7_9GAMM|nr:MULTISPECIES: c-type cytochrome [unclassified Psychrobacter]AWT48629.1 cytochrome c5 family protein [Psychrobacter sp. YP14]UNK05944.1 c-type cytochrome [Psychrobacter sp. PraFG1]
MKKIAMLSAAAILGLSGISLSQAEDAAPAAAADQTTQVAAETTDAAAEAPADAATDAATTDDAAATDGEAAADGEAAPAAPAAPEEPIPQDTPQVKKLIALYPKLIERIQPYGRVCFDGDDSCDITLTASGASADGKPRDGKAVYESICQNCHGSGVLGAPKFGDKGSWAPHVAKGKATLYDHAMNGFNAMPARGGADIPDEEVHNAVDYMVEQSS